LNSLGDDPLLITRLDSQPVLRNLLITQGYCELSEKFAAMLGPQNVTWFTFASWSSKVVGQFLQNEELPDLLRVWIDGSGSATERMVRLNSQLRSMHVNAGQAQARALDMSIKSAINDMRMYLAFGNTQVFGELAPVFGRFLARFAQDESPDDAKLEAYLGTLQAGAIAPDHVVLDPQTQELALVSRGGQDLLMHALRHYYRAKFESNPKQRAELILLANASIGLHEQTRLQTYIAGALDAPIGNTLIDTTHDALAECLGDDLLGTRGYVLVDRLLAPLTARVQDIFHHFATECMMTLKLPDGTIRLGRDLPASPGEPLFPKLLETLVDPDLAALFARYNALAQRSDPLWALRRIEDSASQLLLGALGLERETAVGTRADDWVSLDQRMRFILELFRSRQQNQRLLAPTFSAAQVAQLKQGQIPSGPLT
jgi:hypothetical protein